jgi:hypothetical protein
MLISVLVMKGYTIQSFQYFCNEAVFCARYNCSFLKFAIESKIVLSKIQYNGFRSLQFATILCAAYKVRHGF